MSALHPNLLRNCIVRPDEPRHFMVLKPLTHEVVATHRGRVLARSRRAIRMHEAGYDLYEPVVYFPREDVDLEALARSLKTTHCPLKGDTQYFHVSGSDTVVDDAAWSFWRVCDFDPRLEAIRGRIAFDRRRVHVVESLPAS